MITSAIKLNPRRQADNPSRGVVLVMLSTATSIDALAIGVSLAMLRMAIWYPSIVIGLVTAGMSVLAIVSGNRIGSRLGERAQLVGGVVLLLIGMRIVISHAA
jgi:putative Mn2+ efflux pump MntP